MNAPPLSKVMLARSLETISKQRYRPAIRSIFTSIIFIPFEEAIAVAFLSNKRKKRRKRKIYGCHVIAESAGIAKLK